MKENINVAIAEDQSLFRECLAANLKNYNELNLLIEASDGQELMDKIKASPVVPDVILMDLNMPNLNGLEATRQARSLLPNIKVVILSVHDEETYITRMVQLGINGYLAKNSTMDEVHRAIVAAHQTGFYFNESVKAILQSGALHKRNRIKDFDAVSHFTRREKEILELICKEFTTQEIADKLFLSIRTVDGYRNNLLEKTGARNTAGLVVYAFKHNMVSLTA